MGGGVPSAKFEDTGTVVAGEIATMEMQQQRDFATGELKTWSDGNPMMQLKVVLLTGPVDEEDDGRRAIYLKGQMRDAVREAVKAKNQKGLAIGGKLAVKYVGDGEAQARMNPPKLYKAKYEPPVQSVDLDDEGF
jgi:hypothetical protein